VNLILWRHAEAEEGGEDLARPLTAKGRKQATRMAEWLHARLPQSARVLVSPAVRARQTASALEQLGSRKARIVADLAPGADPTLVLEAVGWPKQGGAVLVIGHQPTLGLVAARLLADLEAEWSLRKGAILWIADRDRASGAAVQLRAALSPDLL
jgi:phosphohistidine phosphatase